MQYIICLHDLAQKVLGVSDTLISSLRQSREFSFWCGQVVSASCRGDLFTGYWHIDQIFLCVCDKTTNMTSTKTNMTSTTNFWLWSDLSTIYYVCREGLRMVLYKYMKILHIAASGTFQNTKQWLPLLYVTCECMNAGACRATGALDKTDLDIQNVLKDAYCHLLNTKWKS